jgi:hypothetical protein
VSQLRAPIGAQTADIAPESFILRLDVDLLQDGLDLVLTANRALKGLQHWNTDQNYGVFRSRSKRQSAPKEANSDWQIAISSGVPEAKHLR